MPHLTTQQTEQVYNRRKLIIETANEREIFLIENDKKLPAKLAGCKLPYCVIYSGNVKAEISWRLAEMLASGEQTEVN